MQPVNRLLRMMVYLLSLAIFMLVVGGGNMLPWVLPAGIVALLVGLSATPVMAWQGRW